jgi:hypothetical protein
MQNEEILRSAGFVRNEKRDLRFSREQRKLLQSSGRDRDFEMVEHLLEMSKVRDGAARIAMNSSTYAMRCP